MDNRLGSGIACAITTVVFDCEIQYINVVMLRHLTLLIFFLYIGGEL